MEVDLGSRIGSLELAKFTAAVAIIVSNILGEH